MLTDIQIGHVRNLAAVSLQTRAGINVLFGANGSGKTSVLEAVSLLGTARSFRTAQPRQLVTRGESECTVFGLLHHRLPSPQGEESPEQHRIGVVRRIDGGRQLRLNGSDIERSSELASLLPLQILTPSTVELLLGAPSLRRRFLNWGVFHVEHEFMQHWSRYGRALRQRNALLRTAAGSRAIQAWDRELVDAGMAIDRFREGYVHRLQQQLAGLREALALEQLGEVTLRYYRGWAADRALEDVLLASIDTDRERGMTGSGPHRADLRLRVHGQPAQDVLSRGELKLLSWALQLSQGALMETETRRRCVYLVDDLPSEFDGERRQRMAHWLGQCGSQVFVTMIDVPALEWNTSVNMFHVEHGTVRTDSWNG